METTYLEIIYLFCFYGYNGTDLATLPNYLVNLLGYTWIHPQSLGLKTHLIKDKLQRTSSRNIAIWAWSLATGGSARMGGWT